MDFVFHFSAASVLPFWVAMIFFPYSVRVKKIISSPWIILPPVLCYLFFLIPNLSPSLQIFIQPGPENLAAITKELWAASLIWAHVGAFDLFIGRWIYLDSLEKARPFKLISPILFVCIFFGPVAFFLYALLNGFKAMKKS